MDFLGRGMDASASTLPSPFSTQFDEKTPNTVAILVAHGKKWPNWVRSGRLPLRVFSVGKYAFQKKGPRATQPTLEETIGA